MTMLGSAAFSSRMIGLLEGRGRFLDARNEKEDLLKRTSEMDNVAFLQLKRKYLQTGEDLLEAMEYIETAALTEMDVRRENILSIEQFFHRLDDSDLLKKGLKVAIESQPQMVLKIFQAIDGWAWEATEITEVLHLADEAYGTERQSERDFYEREYTEDSKEYLNRLIGNIIEWFKEEEIEVPELRNFCIPHKRVRFNVSVESDSE